jgi:hypothetical protein
VKVLVTVWFSSTLLMKTIEVSSTVMDVIGVQIESMCIAVSYKMGEDFLSL